MEDSNDKVFTALLLEVQQQFLWYEEKSSQRFYELEELIEVAAQRMEVLKEKMLKKKRSPTFVNPLAKATNEGTEDAKPLCHLKPKLPNSEEDSEVLDCEQQLADFSIGSKAQEWPYLTEELPDVAQETYSMESLYDSEPVYDEVPGEDKEEWHSEEIICKALGLEDFFQPKQNLEEGNSSGSMVWKCTSEFGLTRREIKSDDTNVPTESKSEPQMPKDLTSSIQMDELWLQQPIPYLITCLDNKPCKFNKQIMIIFDPGGLMPEDHSKNVTMLFKDIIRCEEKLEDRLIGFQEDSEIASAISKEMVDSLSQVELKPPKLQGGEIFDSLHDGEYQLFAEPIYDKYPREGMECLYAKPIYDEDPRKGMECWPEHKLILAALGGSNLHSSILLHPELCTSEGLEEQEAPDSQQKSVPPEDNNRPAGNNSNEKLEMKGHSSFVDEKDIYNKLGNLPKIRMSAKEYVYDLQPVLIIENVPHLELNDLKNPLSHLSGALEGTKVGSMYASSIGLQLMPLRTANSYDLGGLAYENNVLVFDPGGCEQNDHSTSSNKMFKEMIKTNGKLDEVALINSSGGEPWQLEDHCLKFMAMDNETYPLRRKLIMVQMVNSPEVQGKAIQKVRTLKYHKPLGRGIVITIFDPGGLLSCSYEAQFVGGATLNVKPGLQDSLHAEMYLIQMGQRLEVQDPP